MSDIKHKPMISGAPRAHNMEAINSGKVKINMPTWYARGYKRKDKLAGG